jgi:argininosuccinate lyase
MLAHVGLITAGRNARPSTAGLDAILREIMAGRFKWERKLEDVHMNIEQALTKRVPAAAKLHTARSRNDQVATDMRLFFKYACAALGENFSPARSGALLGGDGQSRRAHPRLHAPAAGPAGVSRASSFRLARDARARPPAVRRGGGSRQLVSARLRGHRRHHAAHRPRVRRPGARLCRCRGPAAGHAEQHGRRGDRDVFIEFAAACALTGVHFSRMAEDLILWSSAEFGSSSCPTRSAPARR